MSGKPSPARRRRPAAAPKPMKRLVLISLALVAAAVIGWAPWTYSGPGPSAPEGEVTAVVLKRGAGVREIARSLSEAGVIRSEALFVLAARFTGAATELKAGEYEFPSRASMASILSDIREGKVVVHQVTVPEGMPSIMVVEMLAAQPDLTGPVETPPEGSILPETYQFERGETRAAVLQRMMDAQEKVLAELWPKRQPGLPISTPQQAVTLASVVEKETGVAAERPRVAAVFVNRLRLGMRLQSDPTIIYGVTRGKPLGRGIRMSELNRVTDWNTYQMAGLPKTPIANPGRASLEAVLNPPKTNELYFVADGTGGHVFATNLTDHNANVARWRDIERNAGQAAAAPARAPATVEQ
mgnify:CR=1 FL=1